MKFKALDTVYMIEYRKNEYGWYFKHYGGFQRVWTLRLGHIIILKVYGTNHWL